MVRTAIMVIVILIAETLPVFGPLMDLIGGSTLTLTSLVFPCLFYLYLSAADEKAREMGKKVIEGPLTLYE